MLTLQILLLCALTGCYVHEYVDSALILSPGDDQGKAAVQLPAFPSSEWSFMNAYRNPRLLMSRKGNLQTMLSNIPLWYNSKRAGEHAKPKGLISGRQAETARRRMIDEENDAIMKPYVGGTSDEIEDGDIPREHYTLATKRHACIEEIESQCNRLEEYLCKGMNHPLCLVRYPVSTRGGNKCRVVVRCEYNSTFVSSQGLCFAVRMAFPKPKLPSVDQLALLYNHTVKLYANNTVLKNYTANSHAITAGLLLQDNIANYSNESLTSINIVTDYACSDMTLCSFPT